MSSVVTLIRATLAVIPVALIGGLGAKAFISAGAPAPALPPSATAQVLASDSSFASTSPVAPKLETASAVDSSTTVSLGLPIILPVRSPIRPPAGGAVLASPGGGTASLSGSQSGIGATATDGSTTDQTP